MASASYFIMSNTHDYPLGHKIWLWEIGTEDSGKKKRYRWSSALQKIKIYLFASDVKN